MKTTLTKIRQHAPCKEGWAQLLKHLNKTTADDEPLPLLTVLESNGFDDALWCLRAVEGFDKEKRLLAVAFAREVQHLMTDPRSLAALDVAEKFANDAATKEELELARAAAATADAAWAADADADATADATARAAADAAADAAARAAARAAAWAADAAADAARDAAARDAAAMQQKQIETLKAYL